MAIIGGIGHNAPLEAAQGFAEAPIDVDRTRCKERRSP
jgi:hypothetical protein